MIRRIFGQRGRPRRLFSLECRGSYKYRASGSFEILLLKLFKCSIFLSRLFKYFKLVFGERLLVCIVKQPLSITEYNVLRDGGGQKCRGTLLSLAPRNVLSGGHAHFLRCYKSVGRHSKSSIEGGIMFRCPPHAFASVRNHSSFVGCEVRKMNANRPLLVDRFGEGIIADSFPGQLWFHFQQNIRWSLSSTYADAFSLWGTGYRSIVRRVS